MPGEIETSKNIFLALASIEDENFQLSEGLEDFFEEGRCISYNGKAGSVALWLYGSHNNAELLAVFDEAHANHLLKLLKDNLEYAKSGNLMAPKTLPRRLFSWSQVTQKWHEGVSAFTNDQLANNLKAWVSSSVDHA